MKRVATLGLCALVASSGIAFAQLPPPVVPDAPAVGPEESLNQKLAVWRFDALGIDADKVAQLETLFRLELDRLDKQPMPSRRDLERAVGADLRDCTGEEKCLAAIGKRLGVDVIVTGTVGQMGDAYVLNIKAVDVASGKQVQRIQSDPLRGSPDELIEGVRVAAYRLLAPNQLHGAVQIQTDLVGADVSLDGKSIGKTPLLRQGVVGKLALGKHQLRVAATGYAPFEDDVEVHFQKVSPVVVRLLPSTITIGTGATRTVERRPFYTRTWFYVVLGVAAVGVGAAVGYEAGHVKATCYDAMGVAGPC
ncbi:MAG TPA: PEGA domain-containing protein [Kofleriaceae bacterium]